VASTSSITNINAHPQGAIQVGMAASCRLHFANFASSEDVPSPVSVLGIPSKLVQKDWGLHSL